MSPSALAGRRTQSQRRGSVRALDIVLRRVRVPARIRLRARSDRDGRIRSRPRRPSRRRSPARWRRTPSKRDDNAVAPFDRRTSPHEVGDGAEAPQIRRLTGCGPASTTAAHHAATSCQGSCGSDANPISGVPSRSLGDNSSLRRSPDRSPGVRPSDSSNRGPHLGGAAWCAARTGSPGRPDRNSRRAATGSRAHPLRRQAPRRADLREAMRLVVLGPSRADPLVPDEHGPRSFGRGRGRQGGGAADRRTTSACRSRRRAGPRG
jgi:hypothetical protein